MGTDARVRYTKMVIRNAFLGLLAEMPIGKVTVKAICDIAEVNRATFYKHYDNAFDLLDSIERALLDELDSVMRSSAAKEVRDTLMVMLSKVLENGDLYRVISSENGDPSFPSKVFKVCYDATEPSLAQSHPQMSEARLAWLYSFAAQGASGVLECWLRNGMAEPIGDVALFIEERIGASVAE